MSVADFATYKTYQYFSLVIASRKKGEILLLIKHINTSAKLAFLAKPLGKIKNKYLILSRTFVVGMALKIVISSYAGLLLLACIYPVLISLKIRPITAIYVLSLLHLIIVQIEIQSIWRIW
ncbi:hypothetical protein oki169_15030 [Helicobacter pylori]